MKRAVDRADGHLGQLCKQVNAAALFRHRCDPRRFRSHKITNHPETIPLVAVPSKRGLPLPSRIQKIGTRKNIRSPADFVSRRDWAANWKAQNNLLTAGRVRKI